MLTTINDNRDAIPEVVSASSLTTAACDWNHEKPQGGEHAARACVSSGSRVESKGLSGELRYTYT